MEVCACPDVPLRAWSSADYPRGRGVSPDHQTKIQYTSSVVLGVLSDLFCAIFIYLFVVGWATLGAMTVLMGAILGLKSKRGLLHGAAAGAYFYILFFKASVGFWNSFADEPVSFLHSLVAISRLLNPALLYLGELIRPVGNQDVEDQMGTVGTFNDHEIKRSIKTDKTRAADERPRRSVRWLSRITDQNMYDDSDNTIHARYDFRIFHTAK